MTTMQSSLSLSPLDKVRLVTVITNGPLQDVKQSYSSPLLYFDNALPKRFTWQAF